MQKLRHLLTLTFPCHLMKKPKLNPIRMRLDLNSGKRQLFTLAFILIVITVSGIIGKINMGIRHRRLRNIFVDRLLTPLILPLKSYRHTRARRQLEFALLIQHNIRFILTRIDHKMIMMSRFLPARP